MSARSLHVSHSAPNLTPLQAVHISRRGGGGGTLGVSSCATAPLLPPTSFTPQHQPNQQPPITTSVQLQHPPPVGNNDHTVQVSTHSKSSLKRTGTLQKKNQITSLPFCKCTIYYTKQFSLSLAQNSSSSFIPKGSHLNRIII
ncbi:unnamed protein product [Anisakis simplex]|uniref:Uncharacterized protein n=1 Tax=Anisakis simplex TaxID=6269 RepID=A0A0M3JGZ0_ANISI|nr:unnamed protein product [Anisakis simplex]